MVVHHAHSHSGPLGNFAHRDQFKRLNLANQFYRGL
jgi:hypothetical protein